MYQAPSAAPVLQVGVASRVRDVLRPQVGKGHYLGVAGWRREYPEHLASSRPYSAQVIFIEQVGVVRRYQRRPNLVPVAHADGRHPVIDDYALAVVGLLIESVRLHDLRPAVVEIIRSRRPARS